jgi:serine/threonine protein kinase
MSSPSAQRKGNSKHAGKQELAKRSSKPPMSTKAKLDGSKSAKNLLARVRGNQPDPKQETITEKHLENVHITPLSLQFVDNELEADYVVSHKKKYAELFKTILKVSLVLVLLTSLRPIQEKFVWVLVMKGLLLALILFLMVAFRKVFYNDALLAPLVLLGMLLMLFSRVYREDDEGNIFFGAREADVGFVYLLFCGLAFFMGLRFVSSVITAVLTMVIFVVIVWAGGSGEKENVQFYEQAQATFFCMLGFLLYNVVLLRKLELNSRMDFLLTKRLEDESIIVNLEMEGFKWFSQAMESSGTGGKHQVAPALIAQLQIKSDEIEVKDLIGAGSFCDVFKGKFKATDVAVKQLRAEMDPEVMQEFGAESAIMSQLRHPNICMLMGICCYPPMLILELCQRGSLYRVLHILELKLDVSLLLKVVLEAAHGMAYLHQQKPPILHNDLKSLNLLITNQWQCKVSDFGISQLKKKAGDFEGSSLAAAPAKGKFDSRTENTSPGTIGGNRFLGSKVGIKIVPEDEERTTSISSTAAQGGGVTPGDRGLSGLMGRSASQERRPTDRSSAATAGNDDDTQSRFNSVRDPHELDDMVAEADEELNREVEAAGNFGSLPWTAPEVFRGERGAEKADVYAYGVILFEVLARAMPYKSVASEAIPYLVTEGERPTDFAELDVMANLKKLVDLMKWCWHDDPAQRPDFQEVVNEFEKEQGGVLVTYFGQVDFADKIVMPGQQQQQQEQGRKEEEDNLSFNIKEQDIIMGSRIGCGSYGEVYWGKLFGTNVAIKKMHVGDVPRSTLEHFYQECSLMRQMRHPNLVLFMGSCVSMGCKLLLVTELMEEGDLFEIYHEQERLRETEQHYLRVCRVGIDVSKGMAYLHHLNPPLLHRDLKSPNIFVDHSWCSKVRPRLLVCQPPLSSPRLLVSLSLRSSNLFPGGRLRPFEDEGRGQDNDLRG